MEQYFIYKITFSTGANNFQRNAIDILNKHLPGQIIVNTSLPISKKFAEGKDIGTELEIESETEFDMNTMNIALTLANKDIGSEIIKAVAPVAVSIVDKEGDINNIVVDLVGLSE
jgi:hypothetical protein